MSTSKIKKGDTVRVIAGKEINKEGKVLSVDTKNGKVVVEGKNAGAVPVALKLKIGGKYF